MIETITLSNFEQAMPVSEDCMVLTMPEGPEVGVMTVYTVFPGITVMYNDFHTDQTATGFVYSTKTISIDHCREGRVEWEREDGRLFYLGETDWQLSANEMHAESYGFPTGHYHGITITFSLEEARESLKQFSEIVSVDLAELYDSFSRWPDGLIMRGDEGIEHVFSELYVVQGKVRMSYLRLKVLELLLYLSRIDPEGYQDKHTYFQRTLVEKIHCIKRELCEQPARHPTLRELAEKYEISETAMKKCFKAVYGDSIYAFLKKHRLLSSCALLLRSDKSITEVSMDMGYENPSKYIAAFKKQFGVTPAKFRKSRQKNTIESEE